AERGVTTQEHEAELVVGDDIDQVLQVVELGCGCVVRFHVLFADSEGGEVPVGARGLPAQAVDGSVAGGGGDPRPGVRWCAGDRPAFGGDGERLRDRILGNVDVAEDADQCGGAAADFSSVDRGEVLTHFAWG